MKQQLSEALANLENSLNEQAKSYDEDLRAQVMDPDDFEDWAASIERQGLLIAAARLVERLLPGDCEKCKGTGGLWSGGEEMPQFFTCPVCRGSGRVWDEGIVDHFASVIFNAEFAGVDWATIKAEYAEDGANFEDHHRFYYDAARAVLSAVAELLTEKVEEPPKDPWDYDP